MTNNKAGGAVVTAEELAERLFEKHLLCSIANPNGITKPEEDGQNRYMLLQKVADLLRPHLLSAVNVDGAAKPQKEVSE